MIGLLGGIVVAAGGVIWALIAKARLTDARHEAETLRAENDSLRAKLAEAEAAATDRTSRLETVIADYKRQVTDLEADLARCQDPAVIRDRLRKLLGAGDAG